MPSVPKRCCGRCSGGWIWRRRRLIGRRSEGLAYARVGVEGGGALVREGVLGEGRQDGQGLGGEVFGGLDVRVFKRMYATVDGRYLWADADLQRDWIDFEPIDLTGFRLSGGINFVF